MMRAAKEWFAGLMRNPELVVLVLTVPVVLAVIYLLLGMLSPLFVGVLLAYLLERPVKALERANVPRTAAVSGVITLFFMFMVAIVLLALPRITAQLTRLLQDLPESSDAFAKLVDSVNEHMPAFLGPIDVDTIGEGLSTYMADFGTSFLQTTLASVSDIFSLVVYGVLLPLLLFFLLRDKKLLFAWLGKFIPHNKIFAELYGSLDEQFGAYIRGKIIEGLIVGVMSWVPFALLGLNYAFVLALLVGLSVIIPFVGAILVTIPVLAVAYLQFGNTDTFVYVTLAYLVVQIIDGQVIVPILFSEVVKIHPVGILVAIIFFGNLWGVWGVFFAIPLASLIKSFLVVVENNWSRQNVP